MSRSRSRPKNGSPALGRACALVAALSTVACSTPAARPNVVLISIDSLRADHLGCYGYSRATSPEIDALARQSVLFEHASSTTTWTLPAHLSMLTGLYPQQHGVVTNRQRLNASAPMLPELLAKVGYRSAAVVSAAYLDRSFGFARGWETYDDSLMRFADVLERPGVDHGSVTDERVATRAVELLDQLGAGPFFLFVHFFDVHYDYIPPPPDNRLFDPDYDGTITGAGFIRNDAIRSGMDARDLAHVIALYDGEIRWTDRWIGRIVAELERRGLLEQSLLIVTADHGDEFFEHGHKGHRQNLFDTTLRIPLLIHAPGGRFGGRRVAAPVSLVDVAPTIAAATGAPAGAGWRGVDLLRTMFGRLRSPPTRDLFAELLGTQQAVLRGDLKLIALAGEHGIDPKRLFLVDRATDPMERNNLALDDRRRTARLFLALRGALVDFTKTRERALPEAIEFDPGLADQLKSLGYL